MRCLGTLEFLCDFYERCHFIQKELLAQKDLLSASQTKEEMKFQRDSDVESDKENALPPINDKRKTKSLSRKRPKPIKNIFAVNDQVCVKTEKNEETSDQSNEELIEKRHLSSIENINKKDRINGIDENITILKHEKNERDFDDHEKSLNQSSEIDEADSINESTCIRDDTKIESLSYGDRRTVIKTLNDNEENNERDVKTLKDNYMLLKTDESECKIARNSDIAKEFSSHRSTRFPRKSKEGTFGKISELISDEQKQAIETYYYVNMSIVNSEEVNKSLTVIDKKSIKCNICGTFYPRMDKCQVHIWGHLNIKPYQCKACDFATVTVSNVRCHIRKSHLKIKPFACHLCEKRYVTAVLLEEHLNTHTGARPFRCKVCDFASASRQVLSYHNTTHKPIKDITCKACGKEFFSKGRLRAHMLIHNKDTVVMCKLCSAYLSNQEALEMHHKNIHMRDYICNICGKRLKSRKALYNHQNVHAAAKYKCTLCPNVYKSSHILKEHLLKHEGIRQYKCSVCEKAFAQKSHLAAHMAVHSDIRFHCPGCNKAFNRHDNMKIHTKRCTKFLANPELKNLLTRRQKRTSLNNTRDLSTHLQSEDTSMNRVRNSKDKEDATMKTVINKTDTGFYESKLEVSVEYADEEVWQDGTAENISKTEKMTEISNQNTATDDEVFILENVLKPECF